MTETVEITGRARVPWQKKVNPIWWLKSADDWTAPLENNGEPYLPGETRQWLRDFYWWCRNPCGNFVGYVIGIEDRNYTVTGPAPVMLTTLRDADPPRHGWKWAILCCGWVRLPFVSYYGGWVEFYLGWRPYSGGFGWKLVFPRQ